MYIILRNVTAILHIFPGESPDKFAKSLLMESEQNVFLVFVRSVPETFIDSFGVATDRVFYLGLEKQSLLIDTVKSVLRIWNLVSRLGVRVVYCHSLLPAMAGILLSYFYSDTIFVYVRHHNEMNQILKHRKAIFFDKHLGKRFTKFIAVSQIVRDTMIKEGYPESRIRVIYNGVTIEENKNSRLPNTPVNSFDMIVVGRLSPEKNPLLALEVAENLVSMGLNFTLSFIGAGPLLPKLEKQIVDKNLKNVKMLGFQSNIHSLMREADLLLHVSMDEACPLSLIEALSLGLPVLTIPNGGVKDVVPEVFWLDSTESFDIALKIVDIARNPGLYTGLLGEELDAYVEFFSSRRMAIEYREYSKQLLNLKQ